MGELTLVHTELLYYTDNGDVYPLDAEVPFGHQSHRMSCPNALKCGVAWLNGKGEREEAWHLCPALVTLRETMNLPEVAAADGAAGDSRDAAGIDEADLALIRQHDWTLT